MNDKEYKTLKKVVSLYECNVCQHEEVHRGGSIWTICSNCDMKWADDMGGFKPYTVPTPIVDAYLLISEHEQDQW
jgi:ribosomal protein L37AE/L43A